MSDDLIWALKENRAVWLPTFDRAWYAAQADEMQEDQSKQPLYVAADACAQDAAAVLSSLAKAAAHDIAALGVDIEDRQGLRTGPHKDDPAVCFYLECFEAIATFRYWGAEGDFGPCLDRVELRANEWLNGLPEHSEAVKQVSAAKARAARAEMAMNAQQSGNTRRSSKAKSRARAAWAVFGCEGPSGSSLLARTNKASGAQIAELAELYGYGANVDEFAIDVRDKNSTVRWQLKEDGKP